MSPPTQIDYGALAQQSGGGPAIEPPPTPAPTPAPSAPAIDYGALAQQSGGGPAIEPTAPAQPQAPSSVPSMSDAIHSYIQGVKARNGSTPEQFFQNARNRLTNMNEGIVQHVDRSLLTVAKKSREIDQAHGIYTQGHPLDQYINDTEKIVNAPPPTDPEAAGSKQVGDLFGSIGEYEGIGGMLKTLGLMDRLASLGIKSYPAISKVVRGLLSQGTTGFSQALLQGSSLPQALVAGGESGLVGALAEAPQARAEARAATAAAIAPTELETRAGPVTILASEKPGATPQQTAAATIAETPALREARQAAWQQLPVNLAKDAVTNSLNASNNASVSDLRQRLRDTEDPDLEEQLTKQISDVRAGGAGAPAWSYLTPEGTSLTPAQTRSAMNSLREHWMSQDFSPAEDQAIKERYNDMQDQLGRYDTMQGTQPVGPIYNVADAANSTTSFADASNHMRIVGDRALAEMPQRFRNSYTNLADQRAKLQDQFDANAGVPKLQIPIQREIGRINNRMNDVLQEPDVMDAISQPRAEQALKDKRLSDAFQALHNVMTKHVTLTPAESADLGTPSEARGTAQSLVNDIRAIQDEYGDVLNPAIGDRGLNHILDLGQYMDMPEGKERVNSLLGNMVMVLRRHFQGLRGTLSSTGIGVGGYTLAHVLGHATGATGVGIGALAAEAQAARTSYKLATDPVFNRMIRDRLSTDPSFVNRFLFASKHVPPRHAAPLLGALITAPNMTPPEDNKNATGPRNP